MELLIQIIAFVALVTGTAFSIIGMIGYLRLPDVYMRLHAAGKVSVFGVILILVAAGALLPIGLGTALLFIFLLIVAGPVASHTVASAAYRIGIPMRNPVRDDLARTAGMTQSETDDSRSASEARSGAEMDIDDGLS